MEILEVRAIKSRCSTSHECECCDKPFCGDGAALVVLRSGDKRIICKECVGRFQAQKRKTVALVYDRKSDSAIADKLAKQLRKLGAEVILVGD